MIALHGNLTAAERTMARSPAGAIRVREFHRQLFADFSATLLREIKSIAGVRDTTAEIDLSTGSVVQIFTTCSTVEDLSFPLDGPSRPAAPGHGPPSRHNRIARHEPHKAGYVFRE